MLYIFKKGYINLYTFLYFVSLICERPRRDDEMGKDAIEQLYITQMTIIYKYLVKIGCTKHEAEDIVQLAFIKAIEYMDGVRIEKLPSWLFTVAINIFRTIKKRDNKVSFSLDEEQYFNRFYTEEQVEDSILTDEKRAHIKLVLGKIKKEYSTLLLMKYQAELSYKQISLLLGIPENTVKTYLYRAREEFKINWRNY